MVLPYLKGLVIIKCGLFYFALWIYCVFNICGYYIGRSIRVLNISFDCCLLLVSGGFFSYPSRNILLSFLGNLVIMDSRDNVFQQNEGMFEEKLEESKRLIIWSCSLSSTISFSLDTLVQRRVLVGQLQDDIDVVGSKIEDLQFHLAQRDED